jgi:hypothetical protein
VGDAVEQIANTSLLAGVCGVDGLQAFMTQQRAGQATSAAVSQRLLSFILPLLQHVQGNFRFCRALLGPRSGAIVEPRIQRILADLVREELDACVSHRETTAIPLDIIVQYTVSAFVGLLRWWMNQPTPCCAEEIDRQFRTLTIPAIAAALEVPV